MFTDEYQKVRSEARNFYHQLRKAICPVLNGETIYFSRYGWNHILRKGSVQRPLGDQMRRFRLLRYALFIIKSEDSIIETSEATRANSNLLFWSLRGKVGDRVIRVVIRQKIPNGEKHFFSIMDV
jgi:hypothetical protein